jgi:hypothetical protein
MERGKGTGNTPGSQRGRRGGRRNICGTRSTRQCDPEADKTDGLTVGIAFYEYVQIVM